MLCSAEYLRPLDQGDGKSQDLRSIPEYCWRQPCVWHILLTVYPSFELHPNSKQKAILGRLSVVLLYSALVSVRGRDLNPRPSGYETTQVVPALLPPILAAAVNVNRGGLSNF